MRAIRFEEYGGPEVLRVESVDDPTPGPGQVLVRVAAAGVNFIDTYQRGGNYPLQLPSGLGLEGAGEVIAVGDGVDDARVGRTVAWVDALGSFAELVVVDADRAVEVPDDLAPELGAAVMLQGITAHYLSHSTYALGEGDTCLVYAAAGGVGRLLVQLAKRRGARVLACTSTEEKAAEVRALGADEVLFYRDVDVPAAVREFTDGRGVPVVYDSVGADTFEDSLDCLALRGTMVLYGAASGPVPPVDLQTLAAHGSLFVTRPSIGAYTATADELAWRAGALFDLLRAGELDLRIHDRYPLEDTAQAHTDLESGTTTGKLLVIP